MSSEIKARKGHKFYTTRNPICYQNLLSKQMQATRRLLKSVPPASRGNGGFDLTKKLFLIEPRNNWDLLSSNINTFIAFLNVDARQDFIDTANKGIIDPHKLGSLPLTFALYDELQSPFLKKYKFDAQEFLDGVEPALEEYAHVMLELMAKNKKLSTENNTTDTDTSTTSTVKSTDNETDDSKESATTTNTTTTTEDEENIDHLEKLVRGEIPIHPIMTKESNEVAKKDPDSLEGRMYAMMTQPFYEGLMISPNMWSSKFEEATPSITDVTLISARAAEVLPEEETLESNDTDEGMEDASFANESDREYPVAAQIQVAYTYDLNLSEEDDNEYDDLLPLSQIPQGKRLAIFEGWLYGSPDSEDGLRWRLAYDRPLT